MLVLIIVAFVKIIRYFHVKTIPGLLYSRGTHRWIAIYADQGFSWFFLVCSCKCRNNTGTIGYTSLTIHDRVLSHSVQFIQVLLSNLRIKLS